MGLCLLLLLLDGSLVVICLLLAFWKYLLAVAVLTLGWQMAAHQRWERGRQRTHEP